MADYTVPIFALPFNLLGTETITVTMSGGSTSSTFTATFADSATDWYNYAIASAVTDFPKYVEATLNARETAVGNTATWVVSTPATGISFRLQFTRTGDTDDEILSIAFSSSNFSRLFGIDGPTITVGSRLVDLGSDDWQFNGGWQRDFMWTPRDILTRWTHKPKALVSSAVTPAGLAEVHGYGKHITQEYVIEFVPGALVYFDKTSDADFIDMVSGLANGDENAPLERFWGLCRSSSGGTPPIVRYVPDSTSLGTYTALQISDKEWLSSMDAVAAEVSPAPLFYKVTIKGIGGAGVDDGYDAASP